MLEYEPKDRIKLQDILSHKWFSDKEDSITSAQQAKEKIQSMRKEIKEMKKSRAGSTRGASFYGDPGSTAYVESAIDFEIQKVDQQWKTYQHDGKEFQLLDKYVDPDDIIQSVTQFIEEKNAK
jgi:hypothetical protein